MNLQELVKGKGTRLTLAKGEVVLRQGSRDQNLYFVESGLLKASYFREDGRESIKSFLQEGDIVASIRTCVNGEPSAFTLMCLENSCLVRMSFSEFKQATEVNSEAAQFGMQFLLKLALKKERREFEFLCLSAEERYRLLVSRAPDLLNRVTQNDIAKYLGITAVALSRIRKRLVSSTALRFL